MSHKILVVDSEGRVGEFCRRALGELGYEVVCATEEQAIAAAQEENFALAVVSALHTKMAAIDVFATIRQFHPILAGILVVDHADADTVIDSVNKGFTRICKKPLDPKQLIDAVKETLVIADLREDVTRMKVLLPLYKLGKKFIAAESEKAIYEELADAVVQETQVPSVSVMMLDTATQSLKVVAYRGLIAAHVENLQIKPGEQIAGRVFQSRQPIVLNKSDQHLSPYRNLLKRKELTAAISLPIVSKNSVLGVLNVSETRDGVQFRDADIEMLSIIIDQAMMALEVIRSLKEREESSRIRTLLEQYVSPEVSHLLVRNSQDLLDVGGVQQLTVLFADIRNFTLLVQYVGPTLLRGFLNSFFDMFANIVFSRQGMLDKFMGDAALVIFGAPVKVENPNGVSVSAALQIMEEFEILRTLWAKENKIFAKVGLGIGVSRGPMFLGNVGSSKRLDYTVIGPDVNIAQRLAAAAESGQILITDRVYGTLDPKAALWTEERMLLRGIESEVIVYSLSTEAGNPE
jgi:adenylate cyclase